MNLTVRYWLLIRFSGAWVKVFFIRQRTVCLCQQRKYYSAVTLQEAGGSHLVRNEEENEEILNEAQAGFGFI